VGGGDLVYFSLFETGFTGSPIGKIWVQIHPDYGRYPTVNDWEDNDGSGELDVCDNVHFEADPPEAWWHIEEVGLNTIVEAGPVAGQNPTWGTLKNIYHR
jgi:hypothetical protein